MSNEKYNSNLLPYARQLRKNMTHEEKHLWYDYLRRYPVKFVKQKIIGYYIVDFFCYKANLAIELDGEQHFIDPFIEKDTERTRFLNGYGIMVIRIPNIWVDRYFGETCEFIDQVVKDRLAGREITKTSLPSS